MTTLREIHERCKARHGATEGIPGSLALKQCARCRRPWPCADYSDALAALDMLARSPLVTESVGYDTARHDTTPYITNVSPYRKVADPAALAITDAVYDPEPDLDMAGEEL